MSQSLALAKKPHIVIGESLTKVPAATTGWTGKIYYGEWYLGGEPCDLA